MRAFNSIAKKSAIPLIAVFEIGWVVFVGGVGSLLSYLQETAREAADYGGDADKVLKSPLLFPFYFSIAGGQVVALLFLLHAALPSSQASYIVGVLSSVMNIVYFVSVGYMIRFSEVTVRALELQGPPNSPDDLKSFLLQLNSTRSILAGTIIMTIGWGLIQLLYFFYEPDETNPHTDKSLWRVTREFALDISHTPSQAFELTRSCRPSELLRFCAFPLIALSAIGWGVCTAGLYKIDESVAASGSTASFSLLQYDFVTWSIFFITPLLYLATLLHAGCTGGAATMSGVFAAILNTFFVTNIGFTVIYISQEIYEASHDSFSRVDSTTMHNFGLGLGGGVVCLFFWTIVYATNLFMHRSIGQSQQQHTILHNAEFLTNDGGDQIPPAAGTVQPSHYTVNQYPSSGFVPGQQLPLFASASHPVHSGESA